MKFILNKLKIVTLFYFSFIALHMLDFFYNSHVHILK